MNKKRKPLEWINSKTIATLSDLGQHIGYWKAVNDFVNYKTTPKKGKDMKSKLKVVKQ